MRTFWGTAILLLAAGAWAQQGGIQQDNAEGSVRAIENEIGRYLGGGETRSILTPGESNDWPLDLKAGQVVLAEARSDAFDPALEIISPVGKAIAANDDRYPGDQRPLLLWRCETDGRYLLRARCFQNKAGGLFYLRHTVSDSLDLASAPMVERTFEGPVQFLLRVPMKAGEVKQIVTEAPDARRFVRPSGILTISPPGLPDAHLERGISQSITDIIVAPVAGDYYVLEAISEQGAHTVRVGAREIAPVRPVTAEGSWSARAAAGAPVLLAFPVKAGDVLEAVAPELALGTQISLTEEPDFAAWDLAKAETNPFHPRPRDGRPVRTPAVTVIPGRARDSRVVAFVVRRDAKLWVATTGVGVKKPDFALTVRPAARPYPAGDPAPGALTIGRTDYWMFDARAGDVMSFNFRTSAFAQRIMVSNADVEGWQWSAEAQPDQTAIDWNMIARKPGRYLVGVSAIGDGAAGAYTVARRVYPAREFRKGSPARGSLVDGQVDVWKFAARPGEPLLMRWLTAGQFVVAVRDDKGADAYLPQTRVAEGDEYGVLTVDEPTTFLVVLTGTGKASYSIELRDLPGFQRKK